jgi:hypothetical protein
MGVPGGEPVPVPFPVSKDLGAFIQPPQHRTGVRVQQRIPLPNGRAIDAIAEAFNVFNQPNWTIETQESSRDYGQQVTGQNRTMQFGFRLTF